MANMGLAIIRSIEEICKQNSQREVRCIPGYLGIDGNETPDQHDKNAAPLEHEE
jgi:hypothetical protein